VGYPLQAVPDFLEVVPAPEQMASIVFAHDRQIADGTDDSLEGTVILVDFEVLPGQLHLTVPARHGTHRAACFVPFGRCCRAFVVAFVGGLSG
jgi:hypothetical protein